MVDISPIIECSEQNINRLKTCYSVIDSMLTKKNPDGSQFFSMESTITDFTYFIEEAAGVKPQIATMGEVMKLIGLDEDLWYYLIYGSVFLPQVVKIENTLGDDPDLPKNHSIHNSDLDHCIYVFHQVVQRQNNRNWILALRKSKQEKVDAQANLGAS